MVKAVIFDLDGLLVDSEPVWFEARKSFMQKYGLEWTNEDHRKQMGVSTEFWANYTYEKINGRLSHQDIINQILNRMISFYKIGKVKILPGAREALEYSSEKYKTGLASGSPLKLINAALDGAGWNSYFSEIVSSDEVKKGKPAPDTYLEVIKRIKNSAKEIVVVEDSAGGILSGLSSGAKVIAVPNVKLMPSKDILDKADMCLNSLHELPMAIEKLNQNN
jgi:HAD superfamily hydrolase (TIGR01509 family)